MQLVVSVGQSGNKTISISKLRFQSEKARAEQVGLFPAVFTLKQMYETLTSVSKSAQVREEKLKARLFLGNLKCSLIKPVLVLHNKVFNRNHFLSEFKTSKAVLKNSSPFFPDTQMAKTPLPIKLKNSYGNLQRLHNFQLQAILTLKISPGGTITLLSKPLSSALSNRMSTFLLETPLLLKKLEN